MKISLKEDIAPRLPLPLIIGTLAIILLGKVETGVIFGFGSVIGQETIQWYRDFKKAFGEIGEN